MSLGETEERVCETLYHFITSCVRLVAQLCPTPCMNLLQLGQNTKSKNVFKIVKITFVSTGI